VLAGLRGAAAAAAAGRGDVKGADFYSVQRHRGWYEHSLYTPERNAASHRLPAGCGATRENAGGGGGGGDLDLQQQQQQQQQLLPVLPPNVTNLMIVAHPDDELVFGLAELEKAASGGGGGAWLVLVLTHDGDAARRRALFALSRRFGFAVWHLAHVMDLSARVQFDPRVPALLRALLSHGSGSGSGTEQPGEPGGTGGGLSPGGGGGGGGCGVAWRRVVTHNRQGEYGHVQHGQTHDIVLAALRAKQQQQQQQRAQQQQQQQQQQPPPALATFCDQQRLFAEDSDDGCGANRGAGGKAGGEQGGGAQAVRRKRRMLQEFYGLDFSGWDSLLRHCERAVPFDWAADARLHAARSGGTHSGGAGADAAATVTVGSTASSDAAARGRLLSVNVGVDGTTREVTFAVGDEPREVASRFCRAHMHGRAESQRCLQSLATEVGVIQEMAIAQL
jgi:hypothetical protein